jgi:hypothetical protein
LLGYRKNREPARLPFCRKSTKTAASPDHQIDDSQPFATTRSTAAHAPFRAAAGGRATADAPIGGLLHCAVLAFSRSVDRSRAVAVDFTVLVKALVLADFHGGVFNDIKPRSGGSHRKMSETIPPPPPPDGLWILDGEMRPSTGGPPQHQPTRSTSRVWIAVAATGWLAAVAAAGAAALPYMRSGPLQSLQVQCPDPTRVSDTVPAESHPAPPETPIAAPPPAPPETPIAAPPPAPPETPIAAPPPAPRGSFPQDDRRAQMQASWGDARPIPTGNPATSNHVARMRHQHRRAIAGEPKALRAARVNGSDVRPQSAEPATPLGCPPAFRAEGVC